MCAIVNRWLFFFPFLVSHDERRVEFLAALGGRREGKKNAVLVEGFDVS